MELPPASKIEIQLPDCRINKKGNLEIIENSPVHNFLKIMDKTIHDHRTKMNLVITIHRGEAQKLIKKVEAEPDFLWGIFKGKHGIIITSDSDCENIEILSEIVNALSFAKKQAESELAIQKEESRLNND